MGDSLPGLLASVDGDERNVLLTLARMWRTLETGEIVSKDVVAAWAMHRLPRQSAELIGYARDAYLGDLQDDWSSRQASVEDVISNLRDRITALL